jgi:hypothetical protein
MSKLDRTLTLTLLTVLCIMGLGAGELLELYAVILVSIVGFVIFGAGVLFSAFSIDKIKRIKPRKKRCMLLHLTLPIRRK